MPTLYEAMRRMKKPENKGFTASFDMLGEAARTHEDAERYFQAYVKAIDAVGYPLPRHRAYSSVG